MSKTVEEAFEEWFKRIDAYNSMPTIEDAFAAGAAHGEEVEREAVLAIATSLDRVQVEGQWLIDLDELEARIRQRGEK